MENIKNTDINEAFFLFEDEIRIQDPIVVNTGEEGTFYPDDIIRKIEDARSQVEKTGKIPDVVSMDIPEKYKARVFELFSLIVAQNERP